MLAISVVGRSWKSSSAVIGITEHLLWKAGSPRQKCINHRLFMASSTSVAPDSTTAAIAGNKDQPLVGKTNLLSNSIFVQLQADGKVEVRVTDDENNGGIHEPTAKRSKRDAQSKEQATSPASTEKQDSTEIPESVLQYERHLRKVRANQRSVAQLCKEKHLKVVWEDSDLIVVEKPPGVLCVPGINNKPNLLQLVWQEHLRLEGDAKSEMIVHRLDMDTSGLVVFSKKQSALKGLQAAFRDREVKKEYHALLCGHLPLEWKSGHIHLPLQRDHRHPPFMRIATPRSEAQAQLAVKDLQTHGFKKLIKKRPKASHTEFRVLNREFLECPSPISSSQRLGEDKTAPEKESANPVHIPVTRVALTPHTGRTHQLRVHCAALGYPIVGDPAYGLYGEAQARGGLDENNRNEQESVKSAPDVSLALQEKLNKYRPTHENNMCLHAAVLGLLHPISGEKLDWASSTPF